MAGAPCLAAAPANLLMHCLPQGPVWGSPGESGTWTYPDNDLFSRHGQSQGPCGARVIGAAHSLLQWRNISQAVAKLLSKQTARSSQQNILHQHSWTSGCTSAGGPQQLSAAPPQQPVWSACRSCAQSPSKASTHNAALLKSCRKVVPARSIYRKQNGRHACCLLQRRHERPQHLRPSTAPGCCP